MVPLRCGGPRGDPQIETVIIIYDEVLDDAPDMAPVWCIHSALDTLCTMLFESALHFGGKTVQESILSEVFHLP